MRGLVNTDTAHVAIHGWPDEQAKAREECVKAWNKMILDMWERHDAPLIS